VVGNLEAAYQTGELGEEDCEGSMVDGSVSYFVPMTEAMKPKLSAGVYWLSGDDPNTTKDEGWNPLWARYPQYSELYVYAFDAEAAGRWSNVLMPYLDLSIMPVKAVKVAALAGQMMADEKNGPGEGDTRGQLWATGPGRTTASVEVEGVTATLPVTVKDLRVDTRPRAVKKDYMEELDREARVREAKEAAAAAKEAAKK